jgi:hypothetical protein
MKRTGESYASAVTVLMKGLTDAELEWIVAERNCARLTVSPAEIEATRLEVFGKQVPR